jgi:protein phosphatase
MKLDVSSICDTGKERATNQDAILTFQDEAHDFALFLVADGMGGCADGEKASSTIVSGMQDWLNQLNLKRFSGSAAEMLCAVRDRLLQINDYIWAKWNQNQVCGSTCSLLFFFGETYGVFSVGDSRIYRCRGLRCRPITRDDVWENQREIIERYHGQDISLHPDYGKLVHAVGSEKPLGYSMFTDALRPGDVFALCSDGVYKMCRPSYLKQKFLSCHWADLDKVQNNIISTVYRNGAADNVSLILVRYMI